jgi:hypothetical protein
MVRFARLAAQQKLEHGQKEMATCSTRPGNARARPDARPRVRRAKQDPMPTPIKPTEALTVHTRSLSTPPECKFTDDRSEHSMPATAQDSTTVDRPP